jgi:pimeloyl-ACP methyl ester carboxylesterase/sugar lactone lactonase YvrE
MSLQTNLPLTLPTDAPRSFIRDIDGVKLHWVEYGRPGVRPPVVFLHGLNDSHLTWSQIAPELARDRKVLVLDLPGHGLSDRPDAGYELAWYTQLVASWMSALGLSQVDIVGHSLGGGIALMLLRVCRGRIRRLVLAAPGGLGKEVSFFLRFASLSVLVERIGQPFMAIGTWLLLSRWRTKLAPGHIVDSSVMNARRGSARAFARTVRDLMDWRGQRHSFFLHAHEIDDFPPIAVLWGDRDAVLPLAHGRALARRIEGVSFKEFVGCGHALHHDDRASFLRAVRDALDVASWPPMRLVDHSSAPRLSETARPALRYLVTAALVASPLGCGGNGDSPSDAGTPGDSAAGLQAEVGAGATPTDGSTAPSGIDGATLPSEIDAGPPPVGTVTFVPGVVVSTLAGSASNGARDGTGAGAQFDNPTGIAIDQSGNLVVTDYDDALVRLVTPEGVVTTVASASQFVDPFEVVVASDGTYYIGTDADDTATKSATSGTIWHVVPATGAVATPVMVSRGWYRPRGLALVGGGGLFVSDRDESVVELLPMPIDTPAFLAGMSGHPGFEDGTANAAEFNAPVGVAPLPDGSWVVADSYNNRIRRVTAAGVVTTFAGDGTYALNDGPAASARFASPGAVATDAAGNVYVSDIANRRIRRIDTTGNVETIAGNGTQSYMDGVGQAAEFYGQEGIAVTPDGTSLYVADGNGGDGSAHSHVRVLSIP